MRGTKPIPDDIVGFAMELADAARRVLAAGACEAMGVAVKPDRSLVTRMDLAIETRLRAMIADRFPDHGIIGEEAGQVAPGASHVWVIDPIDGTAPYIAGIPVSGTLIALAIDGAARLGIIDAPAAAARWLGVEGRPTRLNGRAVRAKPCAGLAQALMTNGNQDYMSAAELPALDALRRATAVRVYGGACLSYGRLAEGRTDLAIDAGQKLFDFAPFRPIVEGAGGVISDWAGAPLTLESGGRVLAAGDAGVHAAALELIAGLGIADPAPGRLAG